MTPHAAPPFAVEGRLLRFGAACPHCGPARLHLAAHGIAASDPIALGTAADDRIIMPPFANAHDHARGVRPIALGAFDLPLELWLATMSNTPACDPYLVAAAALGRQAMGGCGAIMIHYTRPQIPARLEGELRDVARAVRAVGVRTAIAVALRDINPLGYAPNHRILAAIPPEARLAIEQRMLSAATPSVGEQLRWVEDLADELNDPLIDVQYGPYGLEWCSADLLRQIAERSALTGRRVHMHLLESRLQREFLDAIYPQGPVQYLDEIGLLSPRLSIAHAVWLRPDEMELLAARGVTAAINTSSNLHLHNGIAPVAEMDRRGLAVAMGLDGFTVDDDDDAFRELRLNHLLHRGVSLDPGLSLQTLLQAACHGGRFVVTGEALRDAALDVGAPGDAMVLDRRVIAADLVLDSSDADLIAARATKAALVHLVVAGRPVVQDGALTGLNLAELQTELDAQARHGAAAYRDWRHVTAAWTQAMRGLYGAGLHRCF